MGREVEDLLRFDVSQLPRRNIFKVGCGIRKVSQVVLVIKNLSANAGDIRDRVRSLGWEDPLEKEMATHSSILAWRIPWTEEPGGLPSIVSQNSQTQLNN